MSSGTSAPTSMPMAAVAITSTHVDDPRNVNAT